MSGDVSGRRAALLKERMDPLSPIILAILLGLTGAGAAWVLVKQRQATGFAQQDLAEVLLRHANERGAVMTPERRGFSLETTNDATGHIAEHVSISPEVFVDGAQARAGVVDVWRVAVRDPRLSPGLNLRLMGKTALAGDVPHGDLAGASLDAIVAMNIPQKHPANETSSPDTMRDVLENTTVRQALSTLFALRPVRTFEVVAGEVIVQLERRTRTGHEAWRTVVATEQVALALAAAVPHASVPTNVVSTHSPSGRPVSVFRGTPS